MGRRGAALALLFVRVLLRLLSSRSAARRSAWRRIDPIDPASAARAAAEGGGLAAALAVLRTRDRTQLSIRTPRELCVKSSPQYVCVVQLSFFSLRAQS